MLWLVFVALSFLTGLLPLSRWSILVWPAASVGLGIYALVAEPPNYDMHGFGFFVGLFAAVLCLAGWLLGRGVARHTRS